MKLIIFIHLVTFFTATTTNAMNQDTHQDCHGKKNEWFNRLLQEQKDFARRAIKNNKQVDTIEIKKMEKEFDILPEQLREPIPGLTQEETQKIQEQTAQEFYDFDREGAKALIVTIHKNYILN